MEKLKFFNRKEELDLLNKKSEEIDKFNKGSLIAIYGRRRVGKTELVKQFLSKQKELKLYFYIDLAEKRVILNYMSKAIKEQLNEDIIFNDFEDFFKYIIQKAYETKFILIFDEFQRFLNVAPEFITSLQKHWDNDLKNKKIMIILLGSSIVMIQKITSNRTGALYGRALKVKISPFKYNDFRLMFNELNEEEKIMRYGVFGGTPYYLEKTKNYKNIYDAINELIIKKDSELFEEPKNLLEYENVRVHSKYNSILQSISLGKVMLNEIQDYTKITSSNITPYIERLDKLLDLVKRNDPIRGKERLGRYAITDNFFKFWYKFVFENLSALNFGGTEHILNMIKNELNSYIGKIFEDVIKELFILYNGKKINDCLIKFENIGSWWDRNGNEIDVIGYESKDRTFFGAEVKWTSKPVDIDIIDELMRKIKLVDLKGEYQLFLISKSGFTANAIRKMKDLNFVYLDLQDVKALFDNAM